MPTTDAFTVNLTVIRSAVNRGQSQQDTTRSLTGVNNASAGIEVFIPAGTTKTIPLGTIAIAAGFVLVSPIAVNVSINAGPSIQGSQISIMDANITSLSVANTVASPAVDTKIEIWLAEKPS